jgi:hypothetical protein
MPSLCLPMIRVGLKTSEIHVKHCRWISLEWSSVDSSWVMLWSPMNTMSIMAMDCIWVLRIYKLEVLGALMGSLEFSFMDCGEVIVLFSLLVWYKHWVTCYGWKNMFNDFLNGNWKWILCHEGLSNSRSIMFHVVETFNA